MNTKPEAESEDESEAGKRKTGELLPRFLWVCSRISAAYFFKRKKRIPVGAVAV